MKDEKRATARYRLVESWGMLLLLWFLSLALVASEKPRLMKRRLALFSVEDDVRTLKQKFLQDGMFEDISPINEDYLLLRELQKESWSLSLPRSDAPSRVPVSVTKAPVVPESPTIAPSAVLPLPATDPPTVPRTTDAPSNAPVSLLTDEPTTLPTVARATASPTGQTCVEGSPEALLQLLSSISTESALTNSSTAQGFAHDWLSNNVPDTNPCSTEGQSKLLQWYGLIVFYNSTNGDAWIRNDNWLSSTQSDFCNYQGVACTQEEGAGPVVTQLLLGTLAHGRRRVKLLDFSLSFLLPIFFRREQFSGIVAFRVTNIDQFTKL
jgi:hypothetical protein